MPRSRGSVAASRPTCAMEMGLGFGPVVGGR